MKKILFWLILILLSILLIDSCGQAAYWMIKRRFTWDTYQQYKFGIFNVRLFTELVDDDRLVSNKKNFVGSQGGWEIRTDSNRFRIGTNRYFKDKENFVFLGDSVPFGWGVNGDCSVPSKFYNLLRGSGINTYGVINAAIPSYSLYQSVKRFEYEINGKFPVRYLILQIYDPATQFEIWGRKWNKRICWTSKYSLITSRNIAAEENRAKVFLYKYSFIYHSLCRSLLKIKEKCAVLPSLLDLNDTGSFNFFKEENLAVLEELYGMLKRNSIILIILPADLSMSRSDFSERDFSALSLAIQKRLIVIDRLNQILREFAFSHKNVYYFDIAEYFSKIDKSALFLDSCHLTEKGAQVQGEFIFEQLKKNNLL